MQFVFKPLIRENTVEAREYQLRLAERALSGNTLVVLPTGLGKTTIAALVAAKKLSADHGSKVLMIAPTKPLATQHCNVLQELLSLPREEFALFIGTTKASERLKLWKLARVISATPQTIEKELEKGRIQLSDVGLLVVDETHRAVRQYSYVKITQKYFEQRHDPLVLGITASPSAEHIREICANLRIRNVEARSETDADVAPYVQRKDIERLYVELPEEMKQIQESVKGFIRDEVEKLRELNLAFTALARKRELLDLQGYCLRVRNFPGIIHSTAALKAYHALELIETQGIGPFLDYLKELHKQDTRSVKLLRGDPRFTKTELIASRLLESGAEHPKLGALAQLMRESLEKKPDLKAIVFSHYRGGAKKVESVLNAIPGVKAVRFVGQSSRGKEDPGLKQEEQQKIISEFRSGAYNVLCCTSVGEEGLDLPSVDLVVFYEPVPSEIRKIQREGRTGRKKPGRVVVLITRNTRDESNFYTARAKEKKMRAALEALKEPQKKLDMWGLV
ncbi:DEAD/DEAH box helicase [archaeon]|nr:DEAD/DEAH box helicase [archaeon]